MRSLKLATMYLEIRGRTGGLKLGSSRAYSPQKTDISISLKQEMQSFCMFNLERKMQLHH